MLFIVAKALHNKLKDNVPAIVDLLNTEYTGQTDYGATVTAPKQYLKGVRSTILELGQSALPVVCSGVYSSSPQEVVEQRGRVSKSDYSFVIQIWLADTDEGKLYETAGMWEDGLKYFVKTYAQALVPNLTAPTEPDVDISNSEPGADGYYRLIVQASGMLHSKR